MSTYVDALASFRALASSFIPGVVFAPEWWQQKVSVRMKECGQVGGSLVLGEFVSEEKESVQCSNGAWMYQSFSRRKSVKGTDLLNSFAGLLPWAKEFELIIRNSPIDTNTNVELLLLHVTD